MKKPIKRSTENRESNLLVRHCFELCRELGISKIIAFAESILDQRFIAECQQHENIILLTRKDASTKHDLAENWHVIKLPEQKITRTDQLQLGLLYSVLNDLVQVDETVLCITGLVGSLRLDNLLITNLVRDNKWFRKHTFDEVPKKILQSQEFYRLMDISLKFAKQGREGKPIGTTFILGEPKTFEPLLKQLILNPVKGHRKGLRNIHNNHFIETLREFSALDGAFIINQQGDLVKAGAYLTPPPPKNKDKTMRGYGARHTSAAAFTAATDSLAVVVSESSGTVTVFYGGSMILELNKQ